jgi:tRNA (guanosine-2'-O-)-methyltransferase
MSSPTPRRFFCEVCDVSCGSQRRLEEHQTGRKHRRASAAAAATAVQEPQPPHASTGEVLRERQTEPAAAAAVLHCKPAAAQQPNSSPADVARLLGEGVVAPTIVACLTPLVSEARLGALCSAAEQRCGGVHLAFENVFKNENCAHALRTAECAGIHNVHLIRGPQALESKRGGSLKRVDTALSKSADRWLRLHYHANTAEFVTWTRRHQLSLYGAHADPTAVPIADCAFATHDGGQCVVLGNERDGMSQELRAACDGLFFLPSVGLTQSCARCMHSSGLPH